MKSNTKPVFCKDCKHSLSYPATELRCRSPRLGLGYDLVTGEPQSCQCKLVRADLHKCSVKGRWFEKLEPKQI